VNDSSVIRGSCHCGSIRFAFTSTIAPEQLSPRACDCSFCQRHGASYISDPNGSLKLEAGNADALGTYRQGHGLAQFVFCHRCGVLVAVLFETEGRRFASLNSRCVENVRFGDVTPVSPQTLSSEQKVERWLKVMIPDVELAVSDR
jgi:hypothetical protein